MKSLIPPSWLHRPSLQSPKSLLPGLATEVPPPQFLALTRPQQQCQRQQQQYGGGPAALHDGTSGPRSSALCGSGRQLLITRARGPAREEVTSPPPPPRPRLGNSCGAPTCLRPSIIHGDPRPALTPLQLLAPEHQHRKREVSPEKQVLTSLRPHWEADLGSNPAAATYRLTSGNSCPPMAPLSSSGKW